VSIKHPPENSTKPEASTPTRRSELDEFIDNLDELLLPDLVEEIEMMCVFYATSTHAALGLLLSDSNRCEEVTQSESLSDLEEDLVIFSRLDTREPLLVGGVPFLTTTRTPMKSSHRLVLHLQVRAKEVCSDDFDYLARATVTTASTNRQRQRLLQLLIPTRN
jgi:hypothetical protein